jgi:hypothetical protein
MQILQHGRSLMKELTEKEKGITVETRELLVSLDEKQKELTEHQTNIVNIKKYASNLQTSYFQEQLPPYNLYDFPICKFCNTDAHVLYSIK